MSRHEPPDGRPKTKAFLGPDILAPVPLRTLSDDWHDQATDPPEERPPEREPPNLVRRVIDRLSQLADRGR